MEERCGNCRFWKFSESLTEVNAPKALLESEFPPTGECRRFPRAWTKNPDDEQGGSSVILNWEFPPHRSDDWCGEWQPAREPEKQEG